MPKRSPIRCAVQSPDAGGLPPESDEAVQADRALWRSLTERFAMAPAWVRRPRRRPERARTTHLRLRWMGMGRQRGLRVKWARRLTEQTARRPRRQGKLSMCRFQAERRDLGD